MEPHAHEMSFKVPWSIESSWRWLNNPDTFIRGQIWPYRVEFVSPDPAVPPGFHVGVLNTHHGPWMNFAGVITEIRPMEYRDLRYFYGAYAFGPRWIRPTRLQFWTEPVDSGTQVRLRVDSLIRKGWARPWTWMQARFWQRFPKWMRRGIDAAETANCPS